MYIAVLNILMANRKWAMVIRIVLLFFQMLLMSFSGSFTGAYLEPDSNGPNLVSKICIFSPTVQFFMGLFTIIYRYPKFSAINREQDTSAIA